MEGLEVLGVVEEILRSTRFASYICFPKPSPTFPHFGARHCVCRFLTWRCTKHSDPWPPFIHGAGDCICILARFYVKANPSASLSDEVNSKILQDLDVVEKMFTA